MAHPADQVHTVARRLVAAAVATFVIGCAAYEIVTPQGVVSLRLPLDTMRLAVRDTIVVRAIALDESGSILVRERVRWNSSVPSIVTVDTLGRFAGIAPGVATVTAQVDTFSASTTVIVRDIAATLEKVAGDNQGGTAGFAVATAPKVRVLGTGGAALAGVEVTLQVVSGGGSLAGTPTVVTDALGEATAGSWTLGTTPGTNTLRATVAGTTVVGNPAVFTATAAAGAPSAANSGVVAAQSTIAASSGATQSTITVTVRDANGNLAPGVPVTIAATGAGNAVVQPTAVTDAQGRTTGRLSSTTPGAKIVTATAAGSVVLDSTATVTVTAGLAANVVSVAGDAQTATVNTPVASAPRVRVTDAFGSNVAGASVTFAVTGGGGSVGVPVTVTTDADGFAAAASWTLGTTAGAHSLSATVAGSGIAGNPVVFTATATAGAASTARSGMGAAPPTIAASNGSVSSSITVRLRDAFGNAVSGAAVTLAATGAGVTLVQPGASDAQGVATGSLSATATGSKTVQAILSGLGPIDSTATVAVTAGAAATQVIVSGTAQTAPVNGTVATAPRVRVDDAFGAPVPGVSVTFAVTGGGGSVIAPATAVTGADGEAAPGGWILGPGAGANTLTATAAASLTNNPATFTATATVGAPSAARSGVNIAPATIAQSGGTSVTDVSVTVRDANGSTVMGASVTLAATGNGNIITQPAATTDALGRATGRVASTVAGTKLISATVGGTTLVDSVATLVVTSVAPTTVARVSADAQSAKVNAAVAQAPSVLVTGEGGLPVAGASVTFAVTLGGGSIQGVATVPTDASGIATIGGWLLGPAAGANALSATVSGAGISGNPVTFTATATVGAPSAARSGVSLAPASVAQSTGADLTIVTITVRDADGSTVMGASVTIAATGAANILTQPAATTDASGRTTARVASSAAGAKVIAATVNGAVLIDSTAMLTVTALPPSSVVRVSADAQSAKVNAAVVAAPSVQVLGAGGIPVAGANVTFAITAGAGSIQGPVAPQTDVNGIASIAGWTLGPAAGVNLLTATVSGAGITGNPVTFSATATVGAPSASVSGLTVSPSLLPQSAGSAYSEVTVTVRDADGATVMGASVAIAATGAGNVITQPGVTDATGRAVGRVASSVAGTKIVSAVVNGSLALDSTATLVVSALAPDSVARVSADGQSATVGGAVVDPPTVRVLAAGGVPVAGVQVTFAITAGGGSITGPAVLNTDNNGDARLTAWVLGTAPGANALTATVTGPAIGGNPITFSATAVVGAPSASRSGVRAAPASLTVSNGGQQSVITVTARDAFGNALPGVSVTLGATGSGNVLTQPVGVTDSNGEATGAISSVNVGAKSVSAVLGGSLVVDSTATVTFTAGAPASVVALAGDGQSALAGANVTVAPAVLVRDALGTPVPNIQVTFAIGSGGGAIVGSATVLTDANGASRPTAWTLGGSPGANTLTATVTGGGITGNPVTFTATALIGPPSAARSGTSASPGNVTISNGSLLSTVTVRVRDANGNAIQGATVTLGATGSGNALTQPAAVTDASGIATGTISSTVAGVKVVTATVNGSVVVDTTSSVTFAQGPPTAVALLEGDAQTARINTALPTVPAVRVLGAGGLPVSGAQVTFAVTGGGGSVQAPVVVTSDAAGEARPGGWVLGVTAGVNALSATVTGAGITGNPVSFSATGELGVPSASRSGIGAAPSSIQASAGATPATITVRVRDAAGAPVQGVTVQLLVSGTGNTITQPSGVTSAAGVATGSFTSTVTEVKSVSAIAAGSVTIDSLAAVTVTPGAPASVIAVAGTGQSATVGTSVSTLPAVRVRDAFNTPVPGVQVTFTVSGGGGSVQPPTVVTTDATGDARPGGWTLGPVAGANSMSATVAGAGITGNPVTFTAVGTAGAVSAAQSLVSASPGTIAASSGGTTSTITVTVRDANGNPIQGASVTLASTGTSNTITQPGGTTNTAGQVTGAISSTLAQAKTISATVNGSIAITQTASVTVNPAAASQLAMITQPSGAVSNVNLTTQPVVEIRDPFGNRVMTATNTITAAVLSGDGTLIGTVSVAASTGRATFTDLRIRGVGVTGDTLGTGAHTLRFTGTSLTQVTSASVGVGISFAYNIQFMLRLPSPRGCTGCHGATFANYSSLVNAPGVFACTTSSRVVPGNTSTSLLYDVVRTLTPFCSQPMPSTTTRWSTKLTNLIRDWILAGAPNN